MAGEPYTSLTQMITPLQQGVRLIGQKGCRMVQEMALMKPMVTALGLAALLATGGVARADDDCVVPMADWQPRAAVQALAQANHWSVRRIKIDDGCYEVEGRDAQGRRFEVKLHPATLAVIEYETGDDAPHAGSDDDRHDEDRHDGD